MFLGNTYIIPAISNLPGQGTAGTPSTFMLDIIPGAFNDLVGAYSLRKLTSTYIGPCCTVRRIDGLGGSLDLNFDPATGYIDVAPAIALSGVNVPPVIPPDNAVLIETWYDQSGNGNHLTGNAAAGASLTLISGFTQLPLTAPSGFYYLGEGSARNVSIGSTLIPASSDISTFITRFGSSSGGRDNWTLGPTAGPLFQSLTGKTVGAESAITGTLIGSPPASIVTFTKLGTIPITGGILNLQSDIVKYEQYGIELEDSSGLVDDESNLPLELEARQLDIQFFVNNVAAGTGNYELAAGEFQAFPDIYVPSPSSQDDNDPAEFLIYKNDKSSIRADIDANTVAYYSLP